MVGNGEPAQITTESLWKLAPVTTTLSADPVAFEWSGVRAATRGTSI